MDERTGYAENRSSLPDLVHRAHSGGTAAIEELVRRFQDFAVGFAFARLRDEELAEDAAQDAFIETWQCLQRLREPAAFIPWFCRILCKRCDRISRRNRAVPALDIAGTMDLMDASAVDDPADKAERREKLREAVQSLSPALRVTTILFYFGGRSHEETAEFLGIKVGTVKSRLHSARAALREELFNLMENELSSQRPSRDEAFVERVRAFLHAAARGESDVVWTMLSREPELLHEQGPHPFWNGRPRALTVAAEWGRLDLIRGLLDAGADPNADSTEYDDWTPLLCSAVKGHSAAADLLISNGATVDAWAAAALGDAARLDELLRADPSLVRARGPNNATPLHFAATEAVARLLVEHGADLETRDKYGATPLRSAAFASRRRDAARYLTGFLPELDVFLATALGDTGTLSTLLSRDPALVHAIETEPIAAFDHGSTPLHIAATLGQLEAATLLLDAGADSNARSELGHTPLHYAASRGHIRLAALLIERGARTDLRDSEHHGTPSDWADFFERSEMKAFLESTSG